MQRETKQYAYLFIIIFYLKQTIRGEIVGRRIRIVDRLELYFVEAKNLQKHYTSLDFQLNGRLPSVMI